MVKALNTNGHHNLSFLEKVSIKLTQWVGTPQSIIFHTFIFIAFASALIMGASFDKVILIWNTLVSLEAIYLALFIQMTVNRATVSLEEVEEDIESIQEDESSEVEAHKMIIHIGQQMKSIQHELDILRKKGLLKSTNIRRAQA